MRRKEESMSKKDEEIEVKDLREGRIKKE